MRLCVCEEVYLLSGEPICDSEEVYLLSGEPICDSEGFIYYRGDLCDSKEFIYYRVETSPQLCRDTDNYLLEDRSYPRSEMFKIFQQRLRAYYNVNWNDW